MYAAEKKKQAKLAVIRPEATTPEEEAFKAELLAGIEEHQENISGIGATDAKKIENVRPDAGKEG